MSFITLIALYTIFIQLLNAYDQMYAKVPNKFPENLSKCLLQDTPSNHKRSCLNSCSADSKCLLACYKDSQCRLYDAKVTRFWDSEKAHADYVVTSEMDGYECFTSWIESKEITNKIVNTSAATTLTGKTIKEKAVDGYYCKGTSSEYYHSNQGFGKYYQVDFGKSYGISKVIVQTRNNPPFGTYFRSVKALVGNSSNSEGDVGNALLGFYEGLADFGEVVTFQSRYPLYGRYMQLRIDEDNSYLIIGEVKIIG